MRTLLKGRYGPAMADTSPTPPPRPVVPASLARLLSDEEVEGLEVEQEPTTRYLVAQLTHVAVAADNRDDAIRRVKAMSPTPRAIDAHRRGSVTYTAVRVHEPVDAGT